MADLEDWQTAAIEDAAASHTVGVAEGRAIVGTGVAVEWKGHWLILTARHVWLATTENNVNFGPKVAGGLVRKKPGEEKRFTEIAKGKKFDIERVHCESQLDLTVIELSKPPANAPNLEFFELADDPAAPLAAGDEVCVLGYPTAVAEEVSDGTYMFSTASDWSSIEDPPGDLNNFDQDIHLALRYTLNEDYELGPHGFSGSGVWSFNGTNARVWCTNLKLRGIVLTYYPNSEILKALRTDRIADFLKGCWK